MQHRLTENVKLLQKIALIHENSVLLLKRSNEEFSRAGCWDLPGGNSEWPKTRPLDHSLTGLHIEDAAREVYEETHISLPISHFSLDKLSYLETHFDFDKQLYSICLGWKLKLEQKTEVILSNEHTEYQWVKLEELDAYSFGEGVVWLKEVILGQGV